MSFQVHVFCPSVPSSDLWAYFLTSPPALVCTWLFKADFLHSPFLSSDSLPPLWVLGLPSWGGGKDVSRYATQTTCWEKKRSTSPTYTLGGSLCWALHTCWCLNVGTERGTLQMKNGRDGSSQDPVICTSLFCLSLKVCQATRMVTVHRGTE